MPGVTWSRTEFERPLGSRRPQTRLARDFGRFFHFWPLLDLTPEIPILHSNRTIAA